MSLVYMIRTNANLLPPWAELQHHHKSPERPVEAPSPEPLLAVPVVSLWCHKPSLAPLARHTRRPRCHRSPHHHQDRSLPPRPELDMILRVGSLFWIGFHVLLYLIVTKPEKVVFLSPSSGSYRIMRSQLSYQLFSSLFCHSTKGKQLFFFLFSISLTSFPLSEFWLGSQTQMSEWKPRQTFNSLSSKSSGGGEGTEKEEKAKTNSPAALSGSFRMFIGEFGHF